MAKGAKLSTLILLFLLATLTGCAGGTEFASSNAFSYYGQKDWNMYYWSPNCSAALCNPR